MSRFPIIAQLQYGTEFGKNLCPSPSRIVPLSQKEIPEPDVKHPVLYYVTLRQEKEFVSCQRKALLFEPSAYFHPPHTFLQSVLYLIEPRFYQAVHLPQLRKDVMMRWLKEKLALYPEGKKFLQHLLSNEIDTDPWSNPYFSILVGLLEAAKHKLHVVHADLEGKFKGMTPQKMPEKQSIVLLQMSSGWYAPYGISL